MWWKQSQAQLDDHQVNPSRSPGHGGLITATLQATLFCCSCWVSSGCHDNKVSFPERGKCHLCLRIARNVMLACWEALTSYHHVPSDLLWRHTVSQSLPFAFTQLPPFWPNHDPGLCLLQTWFVFHIYLRNIRLSFYCTGPMKLVCVSVNYLAPSEAQAMYLWPHSPSV